MVTKKIEGNDEVIENPLPIPKAYGGDCDDPIIYGS